jgi:GT2 family glycosyltransferase
MANRTDVSVIIVTRNTCALTRAAVQSVLDSHDSPPNEILVVDNGSTDDTASVLPREFPQIQFIRPEKNLGFARACNLGAKPARGEFLLLLNSDTRLTPEALARAVVWMRARPACAVAGAQLLNADGSRQNSIANFPTLATELLNKSLLRRLRPGKFPGKEHDFREPVEVETVVGAFMLVRKSVWDTLGGLDERYFFFFEETDFCLQARRRGQRVFHLPDVRVWHGQGQTARQVSVGARIEYWRSRYAYFAKNHRLPTRLVLAAGLWLRLLLDSLAAGLCALATLGQNARWRERWRVCSALVRWHLRGCPKKAGLPR